VKHFRSVSQMVGNRVLCSAVVLLGMSGILSAQAGQVQQQTYEQLVAAHPGWVQVPGALVRPDCVHEVPNGATVALGEDGQPTGDVTLKGQFIAHYNSCPEAQISTRHLESAVNKPGHTPGTPFNGWVEDSQQNLSLAGGDNIDLEDGYFYVPNAPSVKGGLIYLFNGIAPAAQNWIIQPVLQYGVGAAGGGNYWAIASWAGGGPTNTYFHSPLETVNAGNLLFGFSEQTAGGSTIDYFIEADDTTTGAYSWLTVSSSGIQWTDAYEGVLEVYNVNACDQLPSSGDALFYDSGVYHGYPAFDHVSPSFTGSVFQSGCNDWVYVNNTYNVSPFYDYTYLFY
jgi:hypothetical protein